MSPAWSPSGREVVFVRWQSLEVVDVVTGDSRQLQIDGLPRQVASQPAWSPDGERVLFVNASYSGNSAGQIWEVAASGGDARPMDTNGLQARGPAYAPDGKTLASACASDDPQDTAKLWDVSNWNLKTALSGHTSHLHQIRFLPDGRHVVSSSSDATVRVWNVATGIR